MTRIRRPQRLDSRNTPPANATCISTISPRWWTSSGLLREEFSADDLHPNEKGYAVMAPLAEAAIKQALR